MKEGLMRVTARNFVSVALSLLLAFGIFAARIPDAAASGGLDLVRDYVGSIAPGTALVDHNIYFVLPVDAQQVTPADWILIDLPNYQDLAGTLEIVGGAGTPTITTVGTTVKVTNLAVIPGGSVQLVGLNATNPSSGQSIAVTIKIANDSSGVVVRNSATTIPVYQGGYVSVSATVETILSSLLISGYTSPSAFVIMAEGSSVISTTVSSGTGYFAISLTGLNPGAHSYSLTSTDQSNRTTSSTSISLFLLASSLTTFTGVLLSPSIELNVASIDPGDTMTLTGSAKPSSQINIFLEAPLRSYTANTDANGDWTYTVPSIETATFTPGQYQVYANVQDGVGVQSITSPTISFLVDSPDISNPPPACDISHGDLNCDSVTNLIDFSILLFHWQTNHKVADINTDTRVNLTDFSIMMFYFTR